MKITVNCTKEHLKKAMYCSLIPDKFFHRVEQGAQHLDFKDTESNCWISVALHDIFPFCDVSDVISNSSRVCYGDFPDEFVWDIVLPVEADRMITAFDKYGTKRLIDGKSIELTFEQKVEAAKNRVAELKPFSFDIDINPHTLDLILKYNEFNLEEVREIIEKAPHLELIE